MFKSDRKGASLSNDKANILTERSAFANKIKRYSTNLSVNNDSPLTLRSKIDY